LLRAEPRAAWRGQARITFDRWRMALASIPGWD
jgi:hypothetical protein